MAMGEWVDLKSKMLKAVQYDPDDGILVLKYQRGNDYAYYDVPESVYENLLAAESHGKYTLANIRNSYRCQKL